MFQQCVDPAASSLCAYPRSEGVTSHRHACRACRPRRLAWQRHGCERHELIQRQAPLRPRRPRGGAEAAGHVHRVDRFPGPHALHVGDHRQRGGRGSRRARRHRSRSSCTPTRASRCATRARGIPVDIEPKTGLTGVEVVFTKLHAGGKFGSGSYAASGGLHGVGASVVNALSERLDVEVDRGGKTWAMSFHRGEPGTFKDVDPKKPSPDAPFEPFVSGSSLRVAGRAAKGSTGTRVRYWADRQIFIRDAAFSLADLTSRARQTAFLVPGLGITIEDLRARGAGGRDLPLRRRHRRVRRLPRDRRPADRHLAASRAQGTFTETIPVLQANGHMEATEVERTCEVDIALRWGTGYETTSPQLRQHHHDAQGRHARPGLRGRPVRRAQDAGRGGRAAAQGRRDREAREGRRARRHDRGADRPPARAAVRGPDEGGARHPGGARHRPAGARRRRSPSGSSPRSARTRRRPAVLLEKVVGEMKTRISARAHKETQRRKNALESSSLPAKLKDCRSTNVVRHRAVHRRGRLGARHREARAELRVPGADADPRQDPQRPEGVDQRHARQRRVRGDHHRARRRARAARSTSTRRATARSS